MNWTKLLSTSRLGGEIEIPYLSSWVTVMVAANAALTVSRATSNSARTSLHILALVLIC